MTLKLKLKLDLGMRIYICIVGIMLKNLNTCYVGTPQNDNSPVSTAFTGLNNVKLSQISTKPFFVSKSP